MKSMNKKVYSTTTLGERGQVVIPAAARSDMGLKKGDKLIVIGLKEGLIGLLHTGQLDQLVDKATKHAEHLQALADTIAKEQTS